MPPDLLVSGGNWGGSFESSPGKYIDPYFVPIGANVTVLAQSPAPGYNVQSVTWGGGTNYSSYISQDANAAAPAPLTIGTNVQTNQLNYVFIADSKARAYTINATVTYTNQAHGSATIVFTTQAPTTSMSLLSQGKTTPYTTGIPVGLQYDNSANSQTWPTNAGVRFTATTSTNLGGSFAFVQIVQPNMTAVVNNGAGGQQGMTWTDGVGGSALDTFGGSATLGYQTDTSSKSPGVYQWTMNAGDPSVTNNMSDTPFASNGNGNLISLAVGTAAAPMTFQTYLMYRGDGGSWVAVAQMNWSWSGGLVTAGSGLVVDPNNPLTSPTPTSATPPALGPVWNGLGKNYQWKNN